MPAKAGSKRKQSPTASDGDELLVERPTTSASSARGQSWMSAVNTAVAICYATVGEDALGNHSAAVNALASAILVSTSPSCIASPGVSPHDSSTRRS